MRVVILCFAFMLNAFHVIISVSQEADSKSRRYEQGPLVKSDYQGVAPNTVEKFAASTMIELRYDYRYQLLKNSRQYQIYITEIDIYSIVVPSRSWNRQLYNFRLLDHEQGHFDIGEIFAHQAKIEIAKKMRAKRRFLRVGSSEEAVIASLDELMDRQFKKIIAKMNAAQNEYDDATDHGNDRSSQKIARESQLEELKKLKKKVKALNGQ